MPEKDDEKEPLFSHVLVSTDPQGRSTGPRTTAGKERSSQNARTHGCTSRTLILPGERQEDYDLLLADWLHDYQPQVATAYELVVQTAQAHWFSLRVQKQCDLAELGLASQNPLEWSDADWKTRERLGRYRTTAERSFHRALGAIEARRKSRLAECERAEAAQQRAQKIEMAHLHRLEQTRIAEEKLKLQQARDLAQAEEWRLAREAKLEALKNKPAPVARKPKKEPFGVKEQWVEVRVTDGVTSTVYVPSNDEMLEEIAKAVEDDKPEPKMVYRRMNFPDGVPPEYGWTNLHRSEDCEKTQAGEWCPLCQVQERGGCGIQRMAFETWKEVIEREKEIPGGHAGPTGVGNWPQPKERGGDLTYQELLAMEQRWKELREGAEKKEEE